MRDSLLVYADKMEPRATGASESDVIDFGKGRSDYGKSVPSNFFQVRVTEAFASGGAGTLKVELKHSDDGSDFSTAIATQNVALSGLTVGALLISQPLPVGFKRYSKVVATVETAEMTAGAVTAWVGERMEA